VSAGVDEARALARRAFELLLSKYTGSLTEEERRQALKGLERFFPEEFLEEELERLEEEGRLRWALRKAFIPPPWLSQRREGAETPRRGQSRDNRKRKELKVKVSASPSLFKDLALLCYRLAERGYFARLKVIRVRDLAPAKLLPPFLLEPLSEKIVRLELEVERS
jgi:hypothetical protein